MTTQPQRHTLQPGQAMALAGRRGGQLVLVEGELLVQPPALGLAGTAVLPPARRVAAPALLPLDALQSLQAIRHATVVVEKAPGWLALLKSALRIAGRARPPAAGSHAGAV